MSKDDKQQSQSRLKELINRGKEQGYLTYSEVNDHLPDDISDPDQVEDIIQMINDLGIKVFESAPDAEELLMSDGDASVDETAAAEAAALLSDDEVSAPPVQLLDAFDEEPSSPIVSMPAAQSSGAPLSAEEPPAVALPSSVALPEMEPDAPAVALPSTEGVAMPDTSSPPPAASATPAPTPPPAPAPTLVRHTCTNCSAVFELDMPAGLTRAVVACPGCQVDQDIVSGV